MSSAMKKCGSCDGHIFVTEWEDETDEGTFLWSHLENTGCDDPDPVGEWIPPTPAHQGLVKSIEPFSGKWQAVCGTHGWYGPIRELQIDARRDWREHTTQGEEEVQ